MKTLLFISHKMNLGGTEKALLSLLQTLTGNSVKITLLLLEKGGVLESEIPHFVKVQYLQDFSVMKPVIENPPHHTLSKFLKAGKISKAFSFIKTYFKIKKSGNWYHNFEAALKDTSHFGTYDIAVAFAGPSDFISYFVVKKVIAKKKIQWIHFDIEKVITNYNFGRKFYPYFNQIFCVSTSAKDIFVKNFPQFKGKTEVFHNMVSAKEIIKCAEEGNTFTDSYKGIRILTVGRLTKEKGQHLIPEVVAKLKEEGFGFRWYLVGEGMERRDIEKQSSHLKIEKHLFFLGEQINPYPFMKDCHIYVQPSLHEGYGITVAEAQVFNKPIVVTNFASAKDLIIHNETGLIVDISNTGIYEAVKSLLLNTELQKRLTSKSTDIEQFNNKEAILRLLN